MITDIRMLSQQLANPRFNNPKDLVAWMGAVQAQSYDMVKWAVGARLGSATIRTVEDALRKGEILRTHVMRPTWHLVAAEDIRWMLKLSAKRIWAANEAYAKGRDMEITESLYLKCNHLLEKILEGNKSLTRQEIGVELERGGMAVDTSRMTRFMMRAETEGVVCSGVDRGGKQTYALLEERVPPATELHREEALARLALKYFTSHSPAGLQDFVWWSGLSVAEARQAVGLISSELVTDGSASSELFVHQSWCGGRDTGEVLHLLPSYDEYLISYKDRTAVLAPEYCHKAFNNWGIFHPVIMYEGRIVGNWTKSVKKGQVIIETSFFERDLPISRELIEAATDRYKTFLSGL